MATPRKKKVETVTDENYTKLEQYAIWLHEWYLALTSAGFDDVTARGIMADKDAYPDWVDFKQITAAEVRKHLEEDEE